MKRILPLLLIVTSCESGTDTPSPVLASIQVDSVETLSMGDSIAWYRVHLRNHGNRPGTYKLQIWGPASDGDPSTPELWSESEPNEVSGHYAAVRQIRIRSRAAALVVETRPDVTNSYIRTDSVALTGSVTIVSRFVGSGFDDAVLTFRIGHLSIATARGVIMTLTRVPAGTYEVQVSTPELAHCRLGLNSRAPRIVVETGQESEVTIIYGCHDPTGRMLMRSEGDGNLQFVAIHPFTGETEVLAAWPDGVARHAPRWSPDMSALAYHGDAGVLWMAEVATGAEDQVMVNHAALDDYGRVDWSPDGTQLSIDGYPDGSNSADVYVVSIASGETTNLTSTESVSEVNARWSPDGSKLAFTRDGSPWILDVDGASEVDTRGGGEMGSWSPDGTKLIVSRSDGLWVYEVASETWTAITPADIGGPAPEWSPDGAFIAFEQDNNVWLVPAEGPYDRWEASTHGVGGEVFDWRLP